MQLLRGLARNTIIYLSAQVGAKAVVFLLLLFIARTLGATNYGKFAFAYALMNLFWILARFGLELLISRDVAQDLARAPRYLGDTLQLHAYLGLAALGLMMASLLFFQKSPETNILVLLLGLAMILNSMAESFTFTFASQEQFGYQSALFASSQLLTLVFVLVALQAGWALIGIGLGFAGAALVYLLAAWVICFRKIASPMFVWDMQTLGQLMRRAVPFAVASAFVGVYYRIDVLILTAFTTDQVVGWYDAAHNFVWALKLIPTSLAAVLLPTFSRMYLTDKGKTLGTYRRIIKYISLAAPPIVFFTFTWAEPLAVLLLGPDYQESGRVLRWLVWAAGLMFINAQQGAILIATGRERQLLLATAVGAISNALLNLILVPRFSLYGAAIASVLSEFMVGAICMAYSGYLMPFRLLASDVLKPFLFLLALMFILALLGASPLLATTLAFICYIAFALSLIPSEDMKLLKAMLRPRALV